MLAACENADTIPSISTPPPTGGSTVPSTEVSSSPSSTPSTISDCPGEVPEPSGTGPGGAFVPSDPSDVLVCRYEHPTWKLTVRRVLPRSEAIGSAAEPNRAEEPERASSVRPTCLGGMGVQGNRRSSSGGVVQSSRWSGSRRQGSAWLVHAVMIRARSAAPTAIADQRDLTWVTPGNVLELIWQSGAQSVQQVACNGMCERVTRSPHVARADENPNENPTRRSRRAAANAWVAPAESDRISRLGALGSPGRGRAGSGSAASAMSNTST
jgi:hypothetical protein